MVEDAMSGKIELAPFVTHTMELDKIREHKNIGSVSYAAIAGPFRHFENPIPADKFIPVRYSKRRSGSVNK